MSNLSHDAAIDAICNCASSVSVLSYQEAVEGYFKLRGLPIPPAPSLAAQDDRRYSAAFETKDGPFMGTQPVAIKRVEEQDDGTITLVIDYWPDAQKQESLAAQDGLVEAAGISRLMEGAQDAVEAFETLRIGMLDNKAAKHCQQ